MAKRRKKKVQTTCSTPIIRPDAAGVDIGATEIYVAVPADRDSRAVRCFQTFTQDLHALGDWLIQCNIKTVAMESTSVYWIPLFQILESRGLEVCLVNARHVKGVPGRKSDVMDCQWLQYLHAVGLLRASFRPAQAVCSVRTVLRHRDNLIKTAASFTQLMQKACVQMNLHLHHVISDLTGVTGLAILDAILAGQRDPVALAQLKDHRIRASQELIAKSLVGDYRPEHLFTLRSALESYRHFRDQIAACDLQIQGMLAQFQSRPNPQPKAPVKSSHKKPQRNEPRFDVAGEMHRILGVDLTGVDGLQASTVHTLFSEIGPDLSRFPSGKHFCSWLGLSPDNRVSGGRVLSSGTRKVNSRAAYALRLAAQCLHRSQSALGDYFRRMRARLGAAKAITAAAHKLARMIYAMLTRREAFNPEMLTKNDAIFRRRKERYLKKEAASLGFQLISNQPVMNSVS